MQVIITQLLHQPICNLNLKTLKKNYDRIGRTDMIQKFDYLKNKNNFLDKTKSIFHNFYGLSFSQIRKIADKTFKAKVKGRINRFSYIRQVITSVNLRNRYA